MADDFCKFFEARMKEYTLPVSDKRKYHKTEEQHEGGAVMAISNILLLRKRSIIKTLNDELKNIAQIEHSKYRSRDNFVVKLLCGIAAYGCFPKKLCINLNREVDTQLAFC